MSAQIVAYYRVSTDKQGKSGHGLEAQRATVEAFAKSHNWPIIAEFTEIEKPASAATDPNSTPR